MRRRFRGDNPVEETRFRSRVAVLSEPDRRRMKVLVAIPSTNQMYSGVGRALVELSKRLADRVDFTFAIDERDPRSLRILWDFTSAQGMSMKVGPHRMTPDAVDPANESLGDLVRGQRWDLIELVGFANANTGRAVLETIGDATALAYTPHDQPLWTVPMPAEARASVEVTHREVLQRADVTFADSEVEARRLRLVSNGRARCRALPLGCDFEAFEIGPLERPPQLLFVGDLAEIRKRFDRVLEVFERLHRRRPEYRLTVIGNRSEEAARLIPEHLRAAIDLKGYVEETELREAYRMSRALLITSDVEAFGLPILEALVVGTPVILGRLETTASLFSDCAGAHFGPLEDPAGLAETADCVLTDWRGAVRAACADRDRLRSRFDWDSLADRKWEALRAAWFRRAGWSEIHGPALNRGQQRNAS